MTTTETLDKSFCVWRGQKSLSSSYLSNYFAYTLAYVWGVPGILAEGKKTGSIPSVSVGVPFVSFILFHGDYYNENKNS